ncbi:hypothetical protein DPEC_G00009850 [Dallia pectoralis]|uniref:Uncharacterized protein n=1 Tax=Dallia pectoralis TaxID=75939 RepID=A0ACC2HMJ4_DALPE|nr:hypothetical protein DPEC_G00009850 [Dallia pectoralis]
MANTDLVISALPAECREDNKSRITREASTQEEPVAEGKWDSDHRRDIFCQRSADQPSVSERFPAASCLVHLQPPASRQHPSKPPAQPAIAISGVSTKDYGTGFQLT